LECPNAFLCCPSFLDSVDHDTLSLFLTDSELTGGSLEFKMEERVLNECGISNEKNYHSDHRALLHITSEAGFDRKIDVNINSFTHPSKAVRIPFIQIGLTEPGRYTFRLTAHGQTYAEVMLLKEVERMESVNSWVGGARIKSIYTYDGNKGFTRYYDYHYFGKSESSGQGRWYQRYHTTIRTKAEVGIQSNGQPQGAGISDIDMTYAEERPIIPNSTLDGKHISYLNVTEWETDDEGNSRGKTEYNFSYVRPYTLSFFNVPDPRIGDGLLLSKRIYNDAYQLMAYDSISYLESPWISYAPEGEYYYLFRAPNYCQYGENIVRTPVYEDFSSFLRTKTYLKKRQINFQDGVISTSRYFYSPDFSHLNPVQVLTHNSDGTEYVKEFQYAREVFQEEGSGVLSEMIDRNMVSIPLQTLDRVGAKYVSGSQISYSFFNPDSGEPDSVFAENAILAPHQFFSYEADSTFGEGTFERIRSIEEVDTHTGFPSQVRQRGWEPEFWEWDPKSHVLLSKTFEGFTTRFEYFEGSKLLRKTIAIDGQIKEYKYDGLNRLVSILSRDGHVIESYRYNLKEGGIGTNFLESKIIYDETAGSGLKERVTRIYVDGLGKVIEKIQLGEGPGGRDMIKAIDYDGFGRPVRQYEPVAGELGTGKYIKLDPGYPHTLTEYEASPLSRPISVVPPEWYATRREYGTNAEAITVGPIKYPPQSLFQEVITDPENVKEITYKDQQGRLVWRQTTREEEVNATQYVYDLKGRLSLVIPPAARIEDENLLFQYQYDQRDNIIRKKLPDQTFSHKFLYDDRNLLTWQQDPSQSEKNYWIHHRYDSYGRNLSSRKIQLEKEPAPNATSEGGFLLQSNEYDGTKREELGKKVRSEVALLDGTGLISTRYAYDRYGRIIEEAGNHHLHLDDPQSRIVSFQWDWADNLLSETRLLNFPKLGQTSWTERTEYDAAGQPVAHYFTPDRQKEQQLNALDYNVKNQLKSRKIGKVGLAWLQKVDYQYLPNGYLASLNASAFHQYGPSPLALGERMDAPDFQGKKVPENGELDLFALKLHYDNPDAPGSRALRNGNISQWNWQVAGRSVQSNWFEYDYLGRLTQSNSGQKHGTDSPYFDDDLFHTVYDYDSRGNLTYLERNGLYWNQTESRYVGDVIDQLSYRYVAGTNQIQNIQDTALNPLAARNGYAPPIEEEYYTYDSNGNITYDPSQEVTIEYNYLNLPERIIHNDGREMYILYDASGRKVSQWIRSCGTKMGSDLNEKEPTGLDISVLPGLLNAEADNQPPLAFFTPSLEEEAMPEQLTLDASLSSDPDGRIAGYFWDLGDGQIAEGQKITHIYETPGKYRVTLVAVDDQGAQSSFFLTVNIEGTFPVDLDGDGFYSDEDCMDSDPSVFPGAPEFCDGIDNDCDGEIDEGGVEPNVLEVACINLAQYRIILGLEGSYLLDVEDADYWSSFPGGQVMIIMPAGVPATLNLIHDSGCLTHYTIAPPDCLTQDRDGDGYTLVNDCDDWNPKIHPGMTERCFDYLDNNCNGEIDERSYWLNNNVVRGDHPNWGRDAYDLRRDYLEGLEFLNGELEAVYFEDGRLYFFNSDSARYEWNLKDHLGNVRVTFTDKNGNGKVDLDEDPVKSEILQESHYYPFGMRMSGPWVQSQKASRYGYNGKEKVDELGLGWLDYGGRWYNPAIGRWGQVDPYSEIYEKMSHFSFVENNPAIATDFNGSIVVYVNGFRISAYKKWFFSLNRFLGAPPHEWHFPNWYRDDQFDYWKYFKNKWNFQVAGEGEYYVDGSNFHNSDAKDRISKGYKEGILLAEKIKSGEISLKDGERIKLIGHSMGAAHAVGIAKGLLKEGIDPSIIKLFVFAAHQPNQITDILNIDIFQIGRDGDTVSSKGIISWITNSSHERIPNSDWLIVPDKEDENYGGHLIETFTAKEFQEAHPKLFQYLIDNKFINPNGTLVND
jgi:RHS repeat-associated protein